MLEFTSRQSWTPVIWDSDWSRSAVGMLRSSARVCATLGSMRALRSSSRLCPRRSGRFRPDAWEGRTGVEAGDDLPVRSAR